MGARSSPGAEETIHAPWRNPGRGPRTAKLRDVTTRPRPIALLLMTLLATPAVLVGCGDRAAEETASTPTTEASPSSSSSAPADEEDTSAAPAFPADVQP